MPAPTYNPGVSTLIYAADSADANFNDLTTMGATPIGSAPRLVPGPSPASDPPGSIDPTMQAIVAGKDGVGKAFVLTYPPSTLQQSVNLIMKNGGTIGPELVHFIRLPIKITGSLAAGAIFAIKYLRFILAGMPFGGGMPQFSTHDALPWSSGGGWPASNPNHGTLFEIVNGNNDDVYAYPNGHDQGFQPIGPYFNDMLAAGNASGTFFPHTYCYRSHQAALAADGVTKQTVAITGDGTFVATAVFSESQAGNITNGQFISIKTYQGKQGGGAIVSNFDGDKACTLTAVNQASGAEFANGTFSTNFAIDLNGLERLWIDDTLVMDVSLAGLGYTPPGGEKQYCGLAQLSAIPVDMGSSGDQRFEFGGVQTQPRDGTSSVSLAVNLGNGDPTNPYGLVWWTDAYVADTPSAQITYARQRLFRRCRLI